MSEFASEIQHVVRTMERLESAKRAERIAHLAVSKNLEAWARSARRYKWPQPGLAMQVARDVERLTDAYVSARAEVKEREKDVAEAQKAAARAKRERRRGRR